MPTRRPHIAYHCVISRKDKTVQQRVAVRPCKIDSIAIERVKSASLPTAMTPEFRPVPWRRRRYGFKQAAAGRLPCVASAAREWSRSRCE